MEHNLSPRKLPDFTKQKADFCFVDIEDISDTDDDDDVEFAHVTPSSSPASTSLVNNSSDDAEWAEILRYTNHLEEEEEKESETWVFKDILSHRKNKRGNWEVHVLWESEEISWEPLALIAVDDPVSCAIYARKNGLLDEYEWNSFCSLGDLEFTDSEDLDDDLGFLECDHQDEDSEDLDDDLGMLECDQGDDSNESRVDSVEHVSTNNRLKKSGPKSKSSLPRKKKSRVKSNSRNFEQARKSAKPRSRTPAKKRSTLAKPRSPRTPAKPRSRTPAKPRVLPKSTIFTNASNHADFLESENAGVLFSGRRVAKVIFEKEKESFLSHILRGRALTLTEKCNTDIKGSFVNDRGKFELISTKEVEKEGGFQFSKKEFDCTYMHSEGPDLLPSSPSNVLSALAAFSSLPPRKAVARLELLQSPAKKKANGQLMIESFHHSLCEDIPERGHDGCGFICEGFLSELMEGCKGSLETVCIQVRLIIPKMGIYKGELMKKKMKEKISNGVVAKIQPKIQLPGSMLKVPASTLENVSDSAWIVVVKNGVCPSTTQKSMERLPWINPTKIAPPPSFEPKKLKDIFSRLFRGLGVPERYADQYIRDSAGRRRVIGSVEKVALPAIRHSFLRGVIDPTGAIPPNSVYITGVSHSPDFPEKIFITRSPCIKAGDGRSIKVVREKPTLMTSEAFNWLNELSFGAVIFGMPNPGCRGAPEMIARGDLDGDLYFCCWDNQILKFITAEPIADVPIPKTVGTNDCGSKIPKGTAGVNSEDWFCEVKRFMQESAKMKDDIGSLMGKFYQLSKKAADADKTNFLRNKDAEAFADAFYDALENGKHGTKIILPAHLWSAIPAKFRLYLAAA